MIKSKYSKVIIKVCCNIANYYNLWGRIVKCGDYIYYTHDNIVFLNFKYCHNCGKKVIPLKYKQNGRRI